MISGVRRLGTERVSTVSSITRLVLSMSDRNRRKVGKKPSEH